MKSEKQNNEWLALNQKYLAAEITSVLNLLVDNDGKNSSEHPLSNADFDSSSAPPALDSLCSAFRLSEFERQVLLMCAGMELDSRFPKACANAHSDLNKPYPSFSLALAKLECPHWSALSPSAPLRYWRLVEIDDSPSVTLAPLRIDERILNYLAGVYHLDARLSGYIESNSRLEFLMPSHQRASAEIISAWSVSDQNSPLPVIQLLGNDAFSSKMIAADVCFNLGFLLNYCHAKYLPNQFAEIHAFTQLLTREAILNPCVILLDCYDLETSDSIQIKTVNKLIESFNGFLFVSSSNSWPVADRSTLHFQVDKPTTAEQSSLWLRSLQNIEEHKNGSINQVVSQFRMNSSEIESVSTKVKSRYQFIKKDQSASIDFKQLLWEACREYTRPRLDDLAQFIDPMSTWDELILPSQEKQILKEISIHLRNRIKVYEQWGFSKKTRRGLGISALFAGPSGTGKTMAAEVLANDLGLDLYRIDLSSVVSKYIGETEKNLRRIFDAAEDNGTILLFDEADALFGKRSEIKDSHDRYANIEVSYLLQRMESYRGLAILTTNRKSALDSAFLRRLRFVVNFPFPDGAHRAQIWDRIFPEDTPRQHLDVAKLANMNITGGSIRNIAMNAAFIAADQSESVKMIHLLQASKSEYAKIEKSLTDSETRGWI